VAVITVDHDCSPRAVRVQRPPSGGYPRSAGALLVRREGPLVLQIRQQQRLPPPLTIALPSHRDAQAVLSGKTIGPVVAPGGKDSVATEVHRSGRHVSPSSDRGTPWRTRLADVGGSYAGRVPPAPRRAIRRSQAGPERQRPSGSAQVDSPQLAPSSCTAGPPARRTCVQRGFSVGGTQDGGGTAAARPRRAHGGSSPDTGSGRRADASGPGLDVPIDSHRAIS